jgi:hypothetical protein
MYGARLSWADEVSLDVELCEIADAYQGSDQHLDCSGDLSLERPSADVAT